jgi:hypothetical protein
VTPANEFSPSVDFRLALPEFHVGEDLFRFLKFASKPIRLFRINRLFMMLFHLIHPFAK